MIWRFGGNSQAPHWTCGVWRLEMRFELVGSLHWRLWRPSAPYARNMRLAALSVSEDPPFLWAEETIKLRKRRRKAA